MRSFSSVVLSGAVMLSAAVSHAQAGVLLAADDPKQIAQVDLIQVLANDSTRWLSVRLKAQARLAVISAPNLEATKGSDAWLRALDFATRERIAAPPGPLAVCPERATFRLADSGLPELPSIAAEQPATANSDVELQRALANAGIAVDLARIDEFSANGPGPYQITWFDAPSAGGATAALRWIEHGASNELPAIGVAGLDSVPVSLIALANDGVSSQAGGEGDPSEFAVKYFAFGADSDYVSARASWQQNNADRWLVEARGTAALFELTVFGDEGQIQPAVTGYIARAAAAMHTQCEADVRAAHARGSKTADDYSCGGADDLAQALSELDFADVRLTRFYGSTSAASAFVVRAGTQQNPRLQATDFETKGCSEPSGAGVSTGGGVTPGTGRTGTDTSTGTGAGESSGTYSGSQSSTEVTTTVNQTVVSGDDGGCSVGLETSDDSCSGDSSSSSSSSSYSDSCSGDSSSDDSSDDSCSGDSSSDGKSADDSCSGNSDSSSNDSSGCGSSDKSGYDGDTCSGNSASSTSQQLTAPHQARPHHVRLSLFTLLAAGLSLPLRRRLK